MKTGEHMNNNSLVSTAIALLVIFMVNATPAEGDNPTNLVFLTASQLAVKIRSRELTSAEVVMAYLEQIKRHYSACQRTFFCPYDCEEIYGSPRAPGYANFYIGSLPFALGCLVVPCKCHRCL